MELFESHKQWRERPADERFNTLAELHAVTLARREASVASRVRVNQLKFELNPDVGDIVLAGAQSLAIPSHWAFGQLCDYTDLPAPHLRRLPADLVVQELNWGVQNAPREEIVMLWANGTTPGIVRCFTTPSYGRLWDSDVVAWLRQMTQDESNGWKRPHAMDEDKRGPAGIYGGDRNIFCFLVNDAVRIDDGSPNGLARGFFCWNSEVRQMSFGFRAFLYQYVCSNHIVWGAEELFSLRMIHLGDGMTARASRELNRVIGAYLNSSSDNDQAVITAARNKEIAKTKDETVEFLRGKKFGFGEKEAAEIVLAAELAGDNPRNLWALVTSATRLSQRQPNADKRNELDKRAGRLLEVVF